MTVQACREDKFPFMCADPGYPPFFYVYHCMFKVLNLTFLLNTFQIAILRHLNVVLS